MSSDDNRDYVVVGSLRSSKEGVVYRENYAQSSVFSFATFINSYCTVGRNQAETKRNKNSTYDYSTRDRGIRTTK
jgi:hypothetical protein